MEPKPKSADQLAFEKAMNPDYTRKGVFQTHNCGRCNNGEEPCKQADNPRYCSYLHARND